jgi:hypothetical protein
MASQSSHAPHRSHMASWSLTVPTSPRSLVTGPTQVPNGLTERHRLPTTPHRSLDTLIIPTSPAQSLQAPPPAPPRLSSAPALPLTWYACRPGAWGRDCLQQANSDKQRIRQSGAVAVCWLTGRDAGSNENHGGVILDTTSGADSHLLQQAAVRRRAVYRAPTT